MKNTSTSTVDEYSFDAWGRRRDKDDWTYTLSGEPALFADRGFTGHEYLEDFKLYNMNGRLYDPVVGRFLSPDPYVQDPGFTQSYNRYSYCLNNPLKFTDPSGDKWHWKWLSPFYWFGEAMQAINDNTPKLRQTMSDLGIPEFSVGTSVSLAGNVNVNASYRGQQVFNSANIDRSGPSVEATYKELTQVRRDYGQKWMEASYGRISEADFAPSLKGLLNAGLYITSTTLTTEGVYSTFLHNHDTYFLKNGRERTIINERGVVRNSPLARNAAKLSSKLETINTVGSFVMAGQAGYYIYNGQASVANQTDFTVGSIGALGGVIELFGGSSYAVPGLGEAVAAYSWARVWTDLGADYGLIGAIFGVNKWSGN